MAGITVPFKSTSYSEFSPSHTRTADISSRFSTRKFEGATTGFNSPASSFPPSSVPLSLQAATKAASNAVKVKNIMCFFITFCFNISNYQIHNLPVGRQFSRKKFFLTLMLPTILPESDQEYHLTSDYHSSYIHYQRKK